MCQYDAIVVGAGLAGVSAANALQQKGKRVLVLEAQTRLGGRIKTLRCNHTQLELGAAWLHGIEHNPLEQLMPFTANIIPNKYDYHDPEQMLHDFALYDEKGERFSLQMWHKLAKQIEAFNQFILSYDVHDNFDYLIEQFIQHHQLSASESQQLRYVLIVMFNYEFGANLNQLSRNSDAGYELSETTGANALNPRGMDEFIKCQLAGINVLTHCVVTAIDYSQATIKVDTTAGVFETAKVIVTLPIGVLKAEQVNFTPPLPEQKCQAISALGIALYNKIIMQFDHVFWDDKEWLGRVSDEEQANVIFNQDLYAQDKHLILFTSGRLAQLIESYNDQQVQEWALGQIKKVYPHHGANLQAMHVTRWGREPYVRCSYSYLPSDGDDNSYAELAKPVMNRVFFAGEATSLEAPSTLQGAYTSGLRAAQEVSMSLQQDCCYE